jgi:uncharacterized integral membrane protein
MKIRTLVIIIVLVLFASFIWVNWFEITKPTTLNVLFQQYQAPLGIALLAWTALLLVSFFIYVFYLKSNLFLRERKNSKALEEAQKLANNAELSRFSEIKNILETELKKINESNLRLETKLSDLISLKNSAPTK